MNPILNLFNIQYPIIQAGMVWCSGWELASAVSNAGGLGLIGSGSMSPEVLRLHIQKCKKATDKPFGVNVPLLYSHVEETMDVLIEEKIKIVFTSAGNPAQWTSKLKEKGMVVVHVVASLKFAEKAVAAGCDAIVAEGFEAGGHNGKEETTTFCLIPLLKKHIHLPIIAAGGIATGRGMLAAMALGADGVQIGTRFVMSRESSAHTLFKEKLMETKEGDTILTLKQLNPVRMIKNQFYSQIEKAGQEGYSAAQLKELLGKGRSKKGIFEGNLEDGELEIGQVAALIDTIMPAGEIVQEIWKEYCEVKQQLMEG